MAKFIFVTGGVVSGLGKGITASSLGMLLTLRGFRVTIQKLDPYINVDPGTMSPYEHGEVFVTNDGAETDLDIGHYERFLGRNLTANSSFSSGQIWLNVINKERKGEYLGKTIQIVPHITNEIIDTMKSVANDVDIVIVEIGGTVGEIESSTFIEAIRQFRNELGDQDSLSVHVTLVPFLEMSGEIKTKPTQISVRELGSMGVFTDIIVCRSSANVQLDTEARKKIALFCNLGSHENVIHNYDSRSIYEVPLTLKEQNFDDIVLKKLGLCAPQPDLKDWRNMVKHMFNGYPKKTVAIVGKYVSVPDAYLSVVESVNIAGISCKIKPEIKLVDSEEIEKHGAAKCLKGVDAIIVPGGFGNRGIEGKIKTAEYARKNNIPYLGIC
ncbi:MAG: CTP synthase, partial [Firmicutes bacterium]|nr:CTP synthase [Bacillota bacterium]